MLKRLAPPLLCIVVPIAYFSMFFLQDVLEFRFGPGMLMTCIEVPICATMTWAGVIGMVQIIRGKE